MSFRASSAYMQDPIVDGQDAVGRIATAAERWKKDQGRSLHNTIIQPVCECVEVVVLGWYSVKWQGSQTM